MQIKGQSIHVNHVSSADTANTVNMNAPPLADCYKVQMLLLSGFFPHIPSPHTYHILIK
jgi:hypothetical protein